MILYRPVGCKELELIARAHFRAFPPRLPSQPIFYPVLTREYAVAIARDWNTTDPVSGFAGFVTEFEVEDFFVSKYEVRQVGAAAHRELWVPSDELVEFNNHIQGKIRILEAFYGVQFGGEVDATSRLPLQIARTIETAEQ